MRVRRYMPCVQMWVLPTTVRFARRQDSTYTPLFGHE